MEAAEVPHNSVMEPCSKGEAGRMCLRWQKHPDSQPSRGQCCPQEPRRAEPLPAAAAGLGTGGEARDLDVVPTFPLKLLLSRDSSSA